MQFESWKAASKFKHFLMEIELERFLFSHNKLSLMMKLRSLYQFSRLLPVFTDFLHFTFQFSIGKMKRKPISLFDASNTL